MTMSGHVENGKIVLDESVRLADGVRVRVEIESNGSEVAEEAEAPTLNERMKSIIGVVDDLPADMARNHDHYLHGQPKR